ncbi:AAA family ATPase [Ralstonia pseudosolanacearum]|uniref:AAA family ATPase n=1 Tax=Ralstonia pseudosolanacearum TaxID=1310165 RepID=UPI0016981508|nr:AAA family ATPase [Ralstonia pseudosolanacearum]NKA35852.1 DNA replication and repair protein RecF [Ralstonia solanacearum]
MAWLHLPATNAPPDVRRLANLALEHFEGLAQTSRQHSQRSIYLVGQARKSLAQASDASPEIQTVAVDGTWPWQRLRSLTIGPFRGFRTPESFDLQKRVLLFYGPNGSGKTSFCEALEYALLGSVEEAEIRRIDGRAYLANLHARRFEPPVLRATDHQNREVVVTSIPDTFRFCFIEKNRIDAFSRIAARPPAQRTELIATLFGMDKFNEFVGHFNESIDQQLVLTAAKQLALTGKRSALVADQLMVSGEAQALLVLANEEAALALTHSQGMTYAGLKALIGTTEAPGRLQQLEGILNAVPPAAIGLSREGLLNTFEASQKGHEEVMTIAAKLEARSSQVSFKDLYTAVLALQATDGDYCPACDTPLVDAKSNPFDKATAGLAQLKELGELQEELKAAQLKAATASRELRRQLATLSTFIVAHDEQETPVGRYLAGLAVEPVGEWWTTIYPARPAQEGGSAADVVTLEQILVVADRVAAQDTASALARQERQRNINERDELNRLRLAIQAQDLKRQQLVDSVTAAKGRIAAFDVDNAQLILDVAQEASDIERDAPIKAAYDRFLALLRSYRNQLPGSLMAGLNDAAMNLYNEFNRNDLEPDKLAALQLPLTGDQKIEISFRGNPQVRVDALRILSEGHIRCLGLAILLAKSQSIQSPLIVFDDAINAIDHDHRSGIRETIFESDYFTQTQLIVTCHSSEFIKDIQQHLPAQRRGDCQIYLFRHHTGDHQPRVTGNVASKNYVVKARALKDALDYREALASCRQGLEMLSEKVWRWLGSHDLGVLTLQLAGVGAEPSLRNLCEALLKRLNDAVTFTHANKPLLIDAYGQILGIPAANLVWTYLNKGTHEEANRDDFDAELVETVVQTLERLDSLDLRPGR